MKLFIFVFLLASPALAEHVTLFGVVKSQVSESELSAKGKVLPANNTDYFKMVATTSTKAENDDLKALMAQGKIFMDKTIHVETVWDSRVGGETKRIEVTEFSPPNQNYDKKWELKVST